MIDQDLWNLLGEMNVTGILFLYERITLILVRADTTKRVKPKGREEEIQSDSQEATFILLCLSAAKFKEWGEEWNLMGEEDGRTLAKT